MAEAIIGNCGSCELNNGNQSCAALGALAAAGMPEEDLPIAKSVLSVGEIPIARVNMDIVFPESDNATARGQKFGRVVNFLAKVPILSLAVTKHDVPARRTYTSDQRVVQVFCSSVLAGNIGLEMPSYPKSRSANKIPGVSKEVLTQSIFDLTEAISRWTLCETDDIPNAQDIANCSDEDLLKAVTAARKRVIGSSKYLGSQAAEDRLRQVSVFTNDRDDITIQQRMLNFFSTEESEQPTEQTSDSKEKGWQDFGNCLGVDPVLFFPERGASTREAKETCKGCVVREECLEYALANGEKFGIWGGLSERERRRIRRQRSIARRETVS